jgi:hypothetical protein
MTFRDVLRYFSSHTGPPEIPFQILVHLRTVRVHSKLRQNVLHPLSACEAKGFWVQPYVH